MVSSLLREHFAVEWNWSCGVVEGGAISDSPMKAAILPGWYSCSSLLGARKMGRSGSRTLGQK